MTTAPEIDPRDQRARQLHAAALAHASPRTLARLRDIRREAAAAAPHRRPQLMPWLAGGAMTAALALAVVMHPGLRAPGTPAAAPSATATAATPQAAAAATAAVFTADSDVAGPLQEDPGFYVWLDSADANALAME